MKTVLIFKGWASSEELYNKLDFNGYKKVFIDENSINTVDEIIADKKREDIIVIGWSMGTMQILRNIEKFKHCKMILLSPTFRFTDNQSEVIVKRMIKGLQKDKKSVLINFAKLNFFNENKYLEYIDEFSQEIEFLDKECLEKGLFYLLEENIVLRNKNIVNEILIVAAKDDKIIMKDNSKKVGESFEKCLYIELENCGHNMIYEKTNEVNEVLRSFINDREGKC